MGMSSFLPDVGRWTLSREHGLPTSLKEFVLCSTVFKKISCEKFCAYICGVPDLTRIGFPEKQICA
jgi:hypothetical protein